MNEASTIIQSAAHEDANIIFGAVLDEKMKDEVKITVIATGFKNVERKKENSVTAAAAAIQHTRTASTFASRLSGEDDAPAFAPPRQPAPTPAPAPSAASVMPPPVSPPPEEAPVPDPNNFKNAYGDDDLDVPAFLRKRQENQ